ncbi:MAG: MBOAT family O-acyltransferase [Oscillospiraceae bacterium]
MAFQSFGFLALFCVTLLLCLPLQKKHPAAARGCLLIACLCFYLAAGWAGFLLLLAGGLVTRLAARRLVSGGGKRPLVLAVCFHIGVLLCFKYTGFLTDGAIVPPFVPLGLSFFTFQQLWYLKEVASGGWSGTESGQEFWLYTFFFPTVSSGPILRPDAFFPQLQGGGFLHPSWEDGAAGLYAIVLGMGKKVLLADSFGGIVNNGYAHLDELTTLPALLVILGYTLQLYFDFSGYCDMAAGLARCLGIRLPINFDSPYRATSLGDFWKRWHITLTTFLRECLYFPLGGNRRGKLRGYVNLLVIFLVSGLWHGAGWTFLLWGLLHGLAMVFEKWLGKERLARVPKLIGWALTFAFVNLAWVYFRAPTVEMGNQLLGAVLSLDFARPEPWLVSGLFSSELAALRILLPSFESWNSLLIAGLFALGMGTVLLPQNTIRRMDSFRPTVWRTVLLALLLTWSVLSFSGITTFIYSNF